MKEETNQMGLMKKLTSAIVASSLVFTMVGSAFAAYTPAAGETAGNRMLGLQIIKGKYADDALALKDEITRAELVTVIVRAFGQEANAALLNGAAAYPDTASHWASGNIAMAKALVEKVGGDAIGMPDGTFAPDAKLTPAQAVAFLMKFLGVKADATKAWPASYLDVAVEKNLITAEDAALLAPMSNDNATRGLVFYLFDRAFSSYDLGAGKTFYTKYVDTTAPVVTVNAVAATTLDSKITITGKVEGAIAAFVGTTPVTLDANGNFSVDYDLPELKEYNIAVTAKDLAGNATEKSVVVTRTVGTVATVEAAAVTVAAGATVDVAAAAKDAKGNTVPGVAISGESTVGTFADGKFTAGEKAGEGELTLKAGELTTKVKVTVTAAALSKVVADKTSAAPGEFVTLIAQDQYGNAITSGVTFSQTSADAMLDSTTGKFMASKAGSYTVTAKVGEATATGTVGVFGSAKKVALVAPESMVANEASEYEFSVNVTDSNGNVVVDYDKAVSVVTDLTLEKNSVNAKNGVATFKVTGVDRSLRNSEVDVDITAENGTTDITGTATVNVIGQVATALKITAPAFLAVNDDKATGSVKVVDQNGKNMLEGSWDVTVAVSGPAYINTSVDTKADKTSITLPAVGAGTSFTLWSVDALETGTITTTASFTGFTSVTGTTKAAYGLEASKIVLTQVSTEAAAASEEEAYVLKIQLQDKNGVPRTVANETVKVKFDTSDYAQLKAKAGATAGAVDTAAEVLAGGTLALTSTKTLEVTFTSASTMYVGVVAEKLTGTVKAIATDKAADLTKSESSVAFVAGEIAKVDFTRDEAINVLKGANTVTKLTAQITDDAGNKIAAAGTKVKFVSASGYDAVKLNGTKAAVEATTDANGQATIEVAVLPYSTSYDITVDADADADGEYDDNKDTLTLNLQDAISASVAVNTYVTRTVNAAPVTTKTGSFTAGETIEIRATVKDNNGLNLSVVETNPESPANYLVIKGLEFETDVVEEADDYVWTLNDNATAADLSDDYYETTLTAAKAGSFGLYVIDESVAGEVKSSAKTISIAPAAQAKLVLAEADSNKTVTVESGKVKAFTVRVADADGNLLSADRVTEAIKFTVDFGTNGTAAATEYYEIRKGSESGSNVALGTEQLTIQAGRNSYTLYVLTNDDDGAVIDIAPVDTVKFTYTDTDFTVNVD
jgi:hypothetical protein